MTRPELCATTVVPWASPTTALGAWRRTLLFQSNLNRRASAAERQVRWAAPVLQYTQTDTTHTLADGLREYYDSHDQLVSGRGISNAAREFFRCHDAAHVVFGCSTDLSDEGVVKIWSLFGTTEGLGLLAAYRLPESKEVYETLRWGAIASTFLRMLWLAPLALCRCSRMSAK